MGFLLLLVACANWDEVGIDFDYSLGELLESGADCVAAGTQPVCAFRVPRGTQVMAPFNGGLVLTRAPETDRGDIAPPTSYAPMFETVYFARGPEPHPTLYIGPLDVFQEPGSEVPFARGEVIGVAAAEELFVSLWYSDGDFRRELFREHPAGWPTVLPHGLGSGTVPCPAVGMHR